MIELRSKGVSLTNVISWVQKLLPPLSEAVNVLIIIPWPQELIPSTNSSVNVNEQESDAVATPNSDKSSKFIGESQLISKLGGQVIVGATLSCTVTLTIQSLNLPPLSIALKTTICSPKSSQQNLTSSLNPQGSVNSTTK